MNRIGWHILICSAIYLLLHLFQNYAFGPEFVRFYFKDILLIPMLMFSIAVVSALFGFRIELGNKEILSAFLYCVLVFEVILPISRENLSADWFDVIAYGMGAILFLAFYKQGARGIIASDLRNEKE
jgi:hypothetical protein